MAPAEMCTHPWKFAVKPFRIVEGLYYVGNRNVSSYLLDTGKGLILIDTGFPQTVYLLLESIRQLGFNPAHVAYIVHCHGHYDHFGGTRALVELTGAKTFLGEADIEILQRRPELSWAPEYGVEFYEFFDADVPVRPGQIISLGNMSIECMSIPGHTPGAMAFFFARIERGRTYTAGLHGGPGLNTLTEEYLDKYGLPKSRRKDYIRSLNRLKEREVDITLGAHPHHADTFEKLSAMTADRNPFIDKAAWRALLDGLEQSVKSEHWVD